MSDEVSSILQGCSKADLRRIGRGHAYKRHVKVKNEFPEIKSESEFADLIEKIINDPNTQTITLNDDTWYYDNKTNTIVLINPKKRNGGTCFRPADGPAYFDRKKKQIPRK